MTPMISIETTNPAMPIIRLSGGNDWGGGYPLRMGELTLQTVERLEELARTARAALERVAQVRS